MRVRTLSLTLLLMLGMAIGALASTDHVRANGVPQLVKLTYLPGLSNFGSQTAAGVLEFSYADGYLKLNATGLERLQHANYHGWLVKSGRNDAIDVGMFNAEANGAVTFEAKLPPINDFGYDLFVLTIEDDPDSSPAASDKRSIGGYFSVVREPNVAAAAGQTQSGPGALPDTGDAGYLPSMMRGGAMGGATALALGLIGFSLITRKRRVHQ